MQKFLPVLSHLPRTIGTLLTRIIAPSRAKPSITFPEHPAVLRGTMLVTYVFFALAMLILLLGHYPAPPTTALPPDMQEWPAIRAADEAWLQSYGWSDPEQQQVHIPIREAMRLLVSQHERRKNEYGDIEEGQALFMGETPISHKNFRGCRTCHYTDPTRGVLVGPNLAGIADRAATRQPGLSAPEYLRQSIVHHDAFVVEGFERGLMLSIVGNDFGEMLSDSDIDNLVAYLMSLTDAASQGIATVSTPLPIPTPFVGEPLMAMTATPLHPGDPGLRLFAARPDLPADHATTAQAIPARFSFVSIPGWLASDIDGVVVVRPPEASYQEGPTLAMHMGNLQQLNIPNVRTKTLTTTETLFATLLERIKDETHGMTLTDVLTVTIGGYPGYVASLSGWGMGDVEAHMTGRLALVLVNPDNYTEPQLPDVFVMMGLATPPEAWTIDPQFAQVLQSIRFGNDDGGDDSLLLHFSPPRIPVPRLSEPDRQHGPRFGCVHCHITHKVLMRHKSNPSCASCHSGTSYQRHCVDCHSIHNIVIPHHPHNPGCIDCHAHGIPGDGVDFQGMLVTFLAYLFHDI